MLCALLCATVVLPPSAPPCRYPLKKFEANCANFQGLSPVSTLCFNPSLSSSLPLSLNCRFFAICSFPICGFILGLGIHMHLILIELFEIKLQDSRFSEEGLTFLICSAVLLVLHSKQLVPLKRFARRPLARRCSGSGCDPSQRFLLCSRQFIDVFPCSLAGHQLHPTLIGDQSPG